MQIVSSLHDLNFPAGTRLAVAFGVFDGVHRGHQRLLATLLRLAAAVHGVPVAVTFEPHPRAVLTPQDAPPLLTSLPQKLRLLEQGGAAAVVVLPFTLELAAQTPETFLKSCLDAGGMRLCGVCVGAGWRFGCKGRGDTAFLRDFGRRHGFRVAAVREVLHEGTVVSSTRIRRALLQGRMSLVERLLGRPYAIEGEVEHGKGWGGEKLSCPTANLSVPGQLLPPHGVYAAAAVLDPQLPGVAPRRHPAVAYIGTAPSLPRPDGQPAAPVVECHLFDYSGSLYGRRLEVLLLEFIRPDQVFPDVAALKRQIDADLVRIRDITSGRCGDARPPEAIA